MQWEACWLPQRDPPCTLSTPLQIAHWELNQEGIAFQLEARENWGDRYEIRQHEQGGYLIGGNTGLLYGAYRAMECKRLGLAYPQGEQAPEYTLRMLNHWDNVDGTIERGYAGQSLFFREGHFQYDAARLRAYARLLASVGINVICINNVNVTLAAQALLDERFLPELAAIAELFAPFGIRLLVAADFAMPLQYDLPTADPMDEQVAAWWRNRVELVYRYVPNLCGFLIKADSEGRPGPHTYGRNHAQGANLLAEALEPYGGILVWRCFVYNCRQDWRDILTDRPKAAYEHYAPLDGCFAHNVILQIKHGPFDFQVREPPSPLLLAMPRTRKALELQLTQEYTGQQIDLYAMQGMWHEIFEDVPSQSMDAIAAVANIGSDANWTGHPFAQLNLFAYGCTAWNPTLSFETVTDRWLRLTYNLKEDAHAILRRMLLTSRAIYEGYTAPLGLCWMVNPGHHYGPNPMGYEYDRWGTYHRADRYAVGIDRTSKGTGFTDQYPTRLRERYNNRDSCPESLLLFFHRLPYGYVMKDGRTLVQRIDDDHRQAVQEVEAMRESLRELQGKLPTWVFDSAWDRMQRQVQNAKEWRDVICDFFHRLSGFPHENQL